MCIYKKYLNKRLFRFNFIFFFCFNPTMLHFYFFFFFQAEDGIRDLYVTGVQTLLFRSPNIVVDVLPYVAMRHAVGDVTRQVFEIALCGAPTARFTVSPTITLAPVIV